ncbi:MAG: hypothetical protein M3081_16520 [Gemmatimonadota bacterium]|nr:hypothetical protein [Gemmatimonadota bacterium]
MAAAAPLERVIDAEKRVTFGLMAQLGVVLTANERASIERRRTASVRAFVSYGRGVWLQVHHRDAEAAASFDDATAADPSFAPARERARESRSKSAAPSASTAIQRATTEAETRPSAPASVPRIGVAHRHAADRKHGSHKERPLPRARRPQRKVARP